MRQLIREKIEQTTTVGQFADSIGMRRATLYNFLNERQDVHVATLERIIEPLDMVVEEALPARSETMVKCGKFAVGGKYGKDFIKTIYANKRKAVLVLANEKNNRLKIKVVCL
jgi:hypothetical protein